MNWFGFLHQGGRKGWPAGWSQPAPLYNKYTKRFEPQKITWVKGRKALKKDIEALQAYYGHDGIKYDKFSIVGKRDPSYTTERKERMRELGYNFFERLLG